MGDAVVGERAELLEEGFAKKFWINHGKKGGFWLVNLTVRLSFETIEIPLNSRLGCSHEEWPLSEADPGPVWALSYRASIGPAAELSLDSGHSAAR